MAALNLTTLLPILATIITTLLAWLAQGLKAKMAASTAADQKAAAWLQLAEWATSLLGKAWDQIGLDLQSSLADGTLSAEERTHIEGHVRGLIGEIASVEQLQKIATTVGLPVPGIIAWVAAKLIETYAAAHDPTITTTSAKAYPVQGGDFVPSAQATQG